MVIKKLTAVLLLIVNKLIPKVNLEINILRKTFFCRNVFHSNQPKKALVSYLTNAFKNGAENKHTNHLESYWAAKTLHDLGYQVDVVDYDYYGHIDFSEYEVIYGFGDQFEESFYCTSFRGKRIVYSPGCNTVYSNRVSVERLIDFNKRGGSLNPQLIRATNQAWPLQKYLSDAIICQGNDFVMNTYKDEFDQLSYYQIDCFPLTRTQAIPIENKDFNRVKNNLLWFGSQGSVHKGLDIALEIISQNPELKLYIRGLNLKKEADVLKPYKTLLENGRVDVEPYVDLQSDEFKTLMMDCGAAIFPSASEGGAAALLTIMSYGGLIPIVTKGVGLDIANIGFVAEETTVNSLKDQLYLYLRLSTDELKERTLSVQKSVSHQYNQEKYTSSLNKILSNILA